MAVNNESLLEEFASRQYIERLSGILSQMPFWKKNMFPDILRKLLPTQKKGRQRCYYDGDDGLFGELAQALAVPPGVHADEMAKRDLAIEITRFLICYPEKYEERNETSPAFLKRVLAGFLLIRSAVNKYFKGAGVTGELWERNDQELEKTIRDISLRVHYLINIIGETIQALAKIKLTTEDINEILASVHQGNAACDAVYQKIRNAALAEEPVVVYRRPFEDDYRLFRHRGVFGFRFRASRGSDPNKGRVYMRESRRGNTQYLDIPIATPAHNYTDEMIRQRLSWIQKSCRELTDAN